MAKKKKVKEIVVKVTLDENEVPDSMTWSAGSDGEGVCKAALLSFWDGDSHEQLHIDLWTKEMEMDEMKYFMFQNIMTMADTLETAIDEHKMAVEMRAFAKYFGEELGVITN